MNRQQYLERSRQLCNLVNNRRAQFNREPLREKDIMRVIRMTMGPEPALEYDFALGRPIGFSPIELTKSSRFVIKDWPKVWASKCAHRWQNVPGVGLIPAGSAQLDVPQVRESLVNAAAVLVPI